jgi:ethanolamine utilization protein EutP (predicted NTPase)
MKANVYYSALSVFMMSVTLIVVTSDKSLVEKIISPSLSHGMVKPMDVGVVRSFYINDVQSVWSVTSCDKASDMISGVPLLHLESM